MISKVPGLPDAPVSNPDEEYQAAPMYYVNGWDCRKYFRRWRTDYYQATRSWILEGNEPRGSLKLVFYFPVPSKRLYTQAWATITQNILVWLPSGKRRLLTTCTRSPNMSCQTTMSWIWYFSLSWWMLIPLDKRGRNRSNIEVGSLRSSRKS